MNIAERKRKAVEPLKRELDALQARLDEADDYFEHTRNELANAESGKARVYGSVQPEHGTDAHAHVLLSAAASAVTNARYNHRTALERSNALAAQRTRAAHLAKLLSSEDALASAVTSAATTLDMVESASQAVQRSSATLASLEQMLNTEELAFSDARQRAAAELFAAVKSGSGQAEVSAANRDKIATLEMARNSAQQELMSAQAALTAAHRQREQACAELRTRQALVKELHDSVANAAGEEAARSARLKAMADLSTDAVVEAQELLRRNAEMPISASA